MCSTSASGDSKTAIMEKRLGRAAMAKVTIFNPLRRKMFISRQVTIKSCSVSSVISHCIACSCVSTQISAKAVVPLLHSPQVVQRFFFHLNSGWPDDHLRKRGSRGNDGIHVLRRIHPKVYQAGLAVTQEILDRISHVRTVLNARGTDAISLSQLDKIRGKVELNIAVALQIGRASC